MRSISAIVAVVTIGGCIGIGTTPEEQRRADQGPYDDGDPEHRPGQPCLACHSSDYSPGNDVFVVAGTIFANASDNDENGLEGAEVEITDSLGSRFVAQTNEAGNFMVSVGGSDGSVVQRSRGRLTIGFEPVFPLSVKVLYGGDEVEMESKIWRDGACASCHRGEAATASQVEKVYVYEGGP